MLAMLENFLERLQKVETHNELNDFIISIRDEMSVDHVVYHSVNSIGEQYAALTYRQDWVERYKERDYARIDPVVQACLRRFHAVDWKRLNWSGKAVKEFLHEAIDVGVGNQGFSIPVRGPSGQFAVFSISSRERDTHWQLYREEHARQLILVSHFVNQKALEIERGSDKADIVSLSPRETDALTLLALGQSRAQAAASLAISEHTLRVYIEGARFKLAAMNTTHAVAKAMNQGLLYL